MTGDALEMLLKPTGIVCDFRKVTFSILSTGHTMSTVPYPGTGIVAGIRNVVEAHPYTFGFLSFLAFYLVVAKLSGLTAKNPKVSYPEVRSQSKVPLFSSRALDWAINGPLLIQDGFERYPEDIFQVPSQDRTSIVLPFRFLEEIRHLPSCIASNSRATSDVRLSSNY
jgi:hypothetical protein